MPTLAILEDSALPLLQMRQALLNDTTFQLMFSCSKGADMKSWLSANTVDVFVADLGLPDMLGIEVITHCKRTQPNTEIMVCTIFEDDEHLFKSLQSGANAYLLKSDIEQSFIHSLNQLLSGGAPMSPRIARRVLNHLHTSIVIHPPPQTVESTSARAILTNKELEVLNLLMRGFRYAEIARTQSCTVHTVNSHIKSIYRKLQVSSKTEAVFEAKQMKIIH
jgi:DNA-binding NarL/FixJ family response regulator